MNRKLLLLLVLLIVGIFSLGANPLTLDDALERARVHNLSLQSNAIDVNAAKRDVDTSWNLFLPSLNLSLSHSGSGPVFNAAEQTVMGPTGSFITVPNSFKDTGLALGLSMQFTLNAAVKEQLESYNLGYQIQKVTYEQAKAEVQRNVTQLFYYLLMEKQNIEVQEANLELARQQWEDVKKKYEEGFASEVELLTSELSYEQMKPPLQQSRNQYESNLLSLKALLGMDLSEPLELEGEIPSLMKNLEVAELKEYLAKSYSITLLDLNLAQIEKQKELNRKQAFTPSLSLQGKYDVSAWNDLYSNSFSDSFSYSVSVVLPLDGFIPNSRTQVGLASMEDSLNKLALQRKQALRQMEARVISQVQNLNMLSLQADLAEQSIAVSERLYEAQEIQYNSGYLDFVTLEGARNNLMRAKQGLLGVQYQYISALIDLFYDLNIQMKELNSSYES
ncbi:TolC family protein [Sphaerochaeta halotolerans]|uniref:TolC family protein n=1 Tax=Sphaerochaeta halotolerans TaxID=2293840 RepID=A0A372MH93_9SPIR|nr:TolC family protein [Sphaerochaeta halotolerans]RFU95104.1 TolC family protein [Sphaerochaeta halotolerans]